MQTLPCMSPSISVQLYLNMRHTLTVCVGGRSVRRGNLTLTLILTYTVLCASSQYENSIYLLHVPLLVHYQRVHPQPGGLQRLGDPLFDRRDRCDQRQRRWQ
jgi:hypothetical protein